MAKKDLSLSEIKQSFVTKGGFFAEPTGFDVGDVGNVDSDVASFKPSKLDDIGLAERLSNGKATIEM